MKDKVLKLKFRVHPLAVICCYWAWRNGIILQDETNSNAYDLYDKWLDFGSKAKETEKWNGISESTADGTYV